MFAKVEYTKQEPRTDCKSCLRAIRCHRVADEQPASSHAVLYANKIAATTVGGRNLAPLYH